MTQLRECNRLVTKHCDRVELTPRRTLRSRCTRSSTTGMSRDTISFFRSGARNKWAFGASTSQSSSQVSWLLAAPARFVATPFSSAFSAGNRHYHYITSLQAGTATLSHRQCHRDKPQCLRPHATLADLRGCAQGRPTASGRCQSSSPSPESSSFSLFSMSDSSSLSILASFSACTSNSALPTSSAPTVP